MGWSFRKDAEKIFIISYIPVCDIVCAKYWLLSQIKKIVY